MKKRQKGKRGTTARTPATRRNSPKTGAPNLDFLVPPEMRGLGSIVGITDSTQKEREHLKLMATGDVARKVWLLLVELVDRSLNPRIGPHGVTENAVKELASMAISAANFLGDLAHSEQSDKLNVQLAASKHTCWPVILSIGHKANKNGPRKAILEGGDKAKEYLLGISLGADALPTLKHIGDSEASPYKRAAALLMNGLLEWRQMGAWRGKPTRWGHNLLRLDIPMTEDNVDRWWSIAKQWLDEQWQTNRRVFAPLLSGTTHKGVPLDSPRCDLYESEMRRIVIDDRMQSAFRALVKRSEL